MTTSFSGGAWDASKVADFKSAYLDFEQNVFINSKETGGGTCLGESLYESQVRLFDGICGGLAADVHDFKILKSRQLGVTTRARAIGLFWLGMFDGMRGAMIFDSSTNRDAARLEIEEMIENLPADVEFPRIKSFNREGVTLENQSNLKFLHAGGRAGKALGASMGLNLLLASELCFAPDTPVICADGRIKKIADMEVGDVVLTHSGATTRVSKTVCHVKNKKPMVLVKPWMSPAICCTQDHKIATARGLVAAGELYAKDVLVYPVREITAAVKSVVLPKTPVRPQGAGCQSIASGATVEINEELGFAVGYFLAEGTITFHGRGKEYKNRPGGITFTRHQSEKAYADRAIAGIRQYISAHRGTKHVKGTKTALERVYGSSFASWLRENFGCDVSKGIPDAVFSWGREFCRGLVAGLVCGDGSKTNGWNGEYEFNRVSLTTTRSSIAFQLRDLCVSLDIGWAAVRVKPAGLHSGRNCQEAWTLTWAGPGAVKLRALMGLDSAVVEKTSPKYRKFEIADGFVRVALRSVSPAEDMPVVYDLEVEHEDHTFRTGSMCVSNCRWENQAGITSLRQSLAKDYENRLYLWESTARGYDGVWNGMWEDAKKDDLSQRTLFLGWWCHPGQVINEDDRRFAKYGTSPLTDREKKRIESVYLQYKWEVTVQQLAWYRWVSDPAAEREDDEAEDAELIQEQPWTEQEAFQLTGTSFFSADVLAGRMADASKIKPVSTWKYFPGTDFLSTAFEPARTRRDVQLIVWEEPQAGASYVVAGDPAFGHDENNDRSACQILRCFADGVDQVGEFASASTPTHQFAWLLASVIGWYGMSGQNAVVPIIEVNGPGEAVWREYQQLKTLVTNGYLNIEARSRGLQNIFNNVRQYVFARSDAMTGGHNYHWKTTQQLKVAIMERLRDGLHTGGVVVRSVETLKEMQSIARDGDTIQGAGRAKDDRVMALAMGVRAWEEKLRNGLIAGRRTREADRARVSLSPEARYNLFTKSTLQTFFTQKQRARVAARRTENRALWRFR